MDQYLSSVIIAIITGLFGIITILLQKKSDKVVNKIDKQTVFIEKEKVVDQKLKKKEKEKEQLIHEVMLLILDTNMAILKNVYDTSEISNVVDKAVFNRSDELKKLFDQVTEEIDDINKEYEIIMEMASKFRAENNKNNKYKNGNSS